MSDYVWRAFQKVMADIDRNMERSREREARRGRHERRAGCLDSFSLAECDSSVPLLACPNCHPENYPVVAKHRSDRS